MFYDNLKKICKSKGTSPSAVALAVGMSKSNVTGWSKGQEPVISTVAKIAQYLNVDIKELIKEPEGYVDIGLQEINSGLSEEAVEKIIKNNPADISASEAREKSNLIIEGLTPDEANLVRAYAQGVIANRKPQ